MSENIFKLQQLNSLFKSKRENKAEENKKTPSESLIQYSNQQEATLQQIRKKQSLPVPTLESKPTIDVTPLILSQELLNSLIKPRDWEIDGRRLMQTVSIVPPSRDDITNLQKLLDERLVSRQAREYPLCPIREELFGQCFDEIIRQVTIDCQERGVILARVRDDLNKTIVAYKTLYEGSMPFSLQKQLNAEDGLNKLEQQITKLNETKQELELKKQFLTNKKEALERSIKEKKDANEQRRKTEIEFLKYQNSHLESYQKQVNPNKNQ
ncbi:unnamed protein product (macronuclear) [Paramecium tetraurelia]|uniref:Uncharacterized protein n=1 Tax=Paramecium tetraurelia TaxID=5888 RepID=A0EEF0_PARTE|nr:uncharacterized protein GSPATT00026013001 [Paramecium tetraurelia]CAK93671.1 unnamed protein product [Paramecium tetraurelia]|eukprot:XP_001461064.1 hypothetical protein (macronuclear) [Paramecium tetraurelia strain d4-2]